VDEPDPLDHVREVVQREAAAERDRGDWRERLGDMLDRLLQPEREQDDPRDHRQVEEPVMISRELCLRRSARL
jgi:hypothetical protein